MTIMDNYAAAAGKQLSAERLLSALERVDSKLKRPLYAIAIADARCQGKDPVNWDRSKILDTLLEREMDFHFSRFQGIDIQKKKISKTLATELEVLLANSCIKRFLPIHQIDMAEYPTLQKRISNAEMDEEEFFDRLGLLRTVQLHSYTVDQNGNRIDDSIEERTEQVVVLSCPDLIKEHLVLKQAFEKHNLDILPDEWQNNPGHLLFLRKLWVDYPDRLKDQTDFWTRFFGVTPPAHFPARIYGDLLWGCTEFFPDLINQAVDCAEKLYQANDQDMEVASCYAKCLVNLSDTKTATDSASAVDRLEALYSACRNSQDIAVYFAQGLLSLSASQALEECITTVDRLKNLYSGHPDCQVIPECYAAGMSVLSSLQDRAKCTQTVAELKKMYNLHHDIPLVGLAYTRSVENLAHLYYEECASVQSDEFANVVNELENLCCRLEIWEKYADDHAAELTCLALFQSDSDSVKKVLNMSREILESHPDEPDIQLSHAMTWFNLTLVQKPQEIPPTLADIIVFLKSHPDIIPDFKKALDKYLAKHPEHTERYQVLREL